MEDEKIFKYQVGTKAMGMSQGIPIAGEIVNRNMTTFGDRIMYVISNIYEPDNPAFNIMIEEKHIIPYDGLKWKQAMEFWNESVDFMKRGEANRKLVDQILSERRITK